MNKPRILVIDDEAQIRKLLEITLSANGYEVVLAENAKEGLLTVSMRPPDLVLLDIGLPDENGHSLLPKIREWFTRPVIVISVQSSEDDIVRALDNGANDYLVKPFRTGELLARIRSAMRMKSGEEHKPLFEYGSLMVDLSSRTVKKNGQPVKLTATEYALLAIFVANEGKVLTHQFLLREVWGPSYTGQSQYLRVFIAQLRKKIEDNPDKPQLLITEPGVGYRFTAGE